MAGVGGSRLTSVGDKPQRYIRIRRFVAISPFANRYSPFAAVFGSAGALPSHFFSSLVPLKVGAYACFIKCRKQLNALWYD